VCFRQYLNRILHISSSKIQDNKVIKARVTVTLKNGVLDPQGKAIVGALGSLGFDGVNSVRQGKVFDVVLQTTDKAQAETELKAMCEKLLANTVIEDYSFDIA
jgi:phosphoribosylformylglycinamidine synthase